LGKKEGKVQKKSGGGRRGGGLRFEPSKNTDTEVRDTQKS